MKYRMLTVAVALALAGCADMQGVQMGSQSAKTVATGSAAGAASANANSQLERCDESLGTLAVVEDQGSPWYYQLRNEYKLQSTVPLIRMLVQQSNCFVVVERGSGMRSMSTERTLEASGEMRQGSNFGKGQMVAADYSLNPSIAFSQSDAGGVGAALGGFGRRLGMLGAVAGSMKFKEASTMLTLVDNRSGVQLGAAEGSASKTDFGAWSSVFGSRAGGSLGGYTNTAEGKVLAGAFADAYNQLVTSLRSYRAQEVRGGLGTGGRLGVSGGSTKASKELGTGR
ncbi:MAG: peptidoglycan-binding protein [Burkholderiaceae bacterium]|nr:peptidoglycan-binding protein [Burkholderiaceae bacterium]